MPAKSLDVARGHGSPHRDSAIAAICASMRSIGSASCLRLATIVGIAIARPRRRTSAARCRTARSKTFVDRAVQRLAASRPAGSTGTPASISASADRSGETSRSRLLCRCHAHDASFGSGADRLREDVGVEDDHSSNTQAACASSSRREHELVGPRRVRLGPSVLISECRRRASSSGGAAPSMFAQERMRASSSIDRSLLGCARTKPPLHALRRDFGSSASTSYLAC